MDEDLLRALGKRQRAAEPSERDGESVSEALSPELAALLEPIDGEEADDLIDGAMRRLDASEPAADAKGESTSETPSDESTAAANWKGAVAVVVAMAAALVLWFGLSSGGGGTMPEYTVVSLQTGPAAMRSDGGGSVQRKVSTPAGGPIDWKFSPSGTVPGTVAVALLATNMAGESKLVRPKGVAITPAGAVRITGPLDRFIALSPGAWTVEVIIGPPDTLPSSPDAAIEAGRDAGWQSVPLEVTITAP